MRHSVKKIIAAACLVGWSNVASSDAIMLGAMQSFQDFCMSGDLSIDAIADTAKSRHYKLVVDRLLPGPNNSTLINKTWQVVDSTGDFALTVTQDDGLNPVRSLQCGVTLPKGTEPPRHIPETPECESCRHGLRLVTTIILLLKFCRWYVADRLEQPSVVEPVDPLERREFHLVERFAKAPGDESPPLCRAHSSIRRSHCRTNLPCSRPRLDAALGEPLAVANRQILRPLSL